MSKTPSSEDQNNLGEQHVSAHRDPAIRRRQAADRARVAELYPSDQRSPLHPKALRMKDMSPGRKVICFNIKHGITGEYTVVAGPHPHHNAERTSLVEGSMTITTRYTDDASNGKAFNQFCSDMGLLPDGEGSWNRWNFVIDANDRHLLPEPDPGLRNDEFGAEEYFHAARSMNRFLLS